MLARCMAAGGVPEERAPRCGACPAAPCPALPLAEQRATLRRRWRPPIPSQRRFEGVVVEQKGFSWVNERPDAESENDEKWGWVGGAPGDYVVLGLDSRSSSDGAGKAASVGEPGLRACRTWRGAALGLAGLASSRQRGAAARARQRRASTARPGPTRPARCPACRGRAAAGAQQAGLRHPGLIQPQEGARHRAPQRVGRAGWAARCGWAGNGGRWAA